MGIVKTNTVGPNDGVNLNLISGTGGYVYVNGEIITGSGSVIIGPQGDTGATGSIGETGPQGATGPKGDTGEQGLPGLDGTTAPSGLTWSGSWDSRSYYSKNSVVGFASASWWSKNNISARPIPLTPNSAPNIDTTNWALLATQGPVGPQGIKGPTGPQGPTGIGLQGVRGIQGPTGAAGPGVASQVSYIPSGLTLTSNTVQGALDQLDSLITDDNVIMVKKGATGSGQFETIKEALDSISNPSETNRWTILVGAGDFYEDLIVCKPWVNIVGRDRTTRILPKTNNQHIFAGSDFSSVISCLVTGAGTGYAAFYHSAADGTPQSAFIIKDVIFGANDTHVICVADSNQTTVQVIDCRYGDDFIFDKGFYAHNNMSSVAARILLLHCYSQGMSSVTKPTYFAKASGENCEIVMNSVQANAASPIQSGTSFLIIENGAKCRLNAVNFTHWDNGIWVPNLGLVGELGSKLIGVGVSCQNTNNHVLIDNMDTYGQLSGTFELNKVSNLSEEVSLTYSDPEVGDFTIAGGLNITYNPTVTTDVSTLIAQTSTMGIVLGGYITDNTFGTGLTLSIAAGFGYYHINSGLDTGILYRLDWPDTEFLVDSNSTLYIYFNSNGILQTDPTIPITSENILLGRVRTNDTHFEFIERTPLFSEHWANRATKLFRKGIGPVYSNGSIVTENITPFHLNISAGIYYYGANEFEPVGGTDINFESYRPDGSGGWIVSATNSVDNSNYSGTNSLIPLTSGYFTKHSLYIVGDNGEEKYFMVYDTNEYSTQLAAENASLPTPPSYFSDAVSLIAGIIIQQGTSSIVEIRDQRPIIGFRAPGINASADHSSLLNLNVDSHTQYLLTNGSRVLTGNLQMGSHSITGVTTINSIDIASHGSRHLPGGSDALATGTPSTIGITNQIGNVNAFARQDHIHAHGNLEGGSLHSLVTTTQSGFMSAPDKVILDNITSSTQSLTNKTITGSTNYVVSDELKTTTNPVYIVATAPSVNQVLMAVSATQTNWQTISTNNISTGTPSTIGTINQIGSSSNFSRQDHIHSHGDQLGGTLHSLVTITQSGFMSAPDKVILDNITSSTQSLTNKTIIGTTNYVDANGLKTTTNPVYIVSTAPTTGQVLISTSATAATWQTIPTGTPSTIGTTNQIGTSSNYAKQDHIHSHGDQLGGTLHALVTTTQSGFMSFGDKVILNNITSSTQSLTNKGITGSTNYVETNALKTNTNPVYIVATAPSVGQVLTAVSATAATWQTPTAVSTQKNPTDPTITSSTIGVMMGLSASITPVLSGKIMIIISGDMDNDSGDDGAQVQMRTGTGTPPINGAALTGTTQGGLVKMSVVVSGGATNVTRVPFSLNTIVNGLTLNTAVWIDLSLAAIGAGNARVRDISMSIVEL